MTTANLDSIKNKIRALLNKTVENGCSEAEAMSAISMANKLMMEYNVAQFDLTVKSDTFHQVSVVIKAGKAPAVGSVVGAIANLTNTKSWYVRNKSAAGWKAAKSTFSYFFFGMDSDPELATLYVNYLRVAIDNEVERYTNSIKAAKLSTAPHINTLRRSFTIGLTNRLYARIMELAAANQVVANASDSRALVVVKDQLVKSAFNDLNMRLRNVTRRQTANSSSAFLSGKAAADRIDLNRTGIDSGSTNLRIS